MYAVVETGGKQYRVSQGETFEVERIDAEAGNEVTFDKVLLVSDGDKVQVGTPTLQGAKVTAEILQHKRGPKVVAFKMRRREGYHRKVGHRQEHTVVKITAIQS